MGRGTGRDFSSLTPDEFNRAVTLFSAQTALTTFFVLAGIMLMVFAEPPLKWLASGAPYNNGNWLATIAAVVLLIGYGLVLAVPGLRRFFDLVPLPISINLGLIILTALWVVLQRAMWRSRWLERFLDMEEDIPD
jgi:cation-transporting ATPase E